MTKLKGFYVDDEDTAAADFRRRLESEHIELVVLHPKDLVATAEQILDQAPAVVVLDYRLDQQRGDQDKAASYRAGPLAQYLRDRAGDHPEIDFPIVLFSSEDKLRLFYKPEKTAHDLFDWKLRKSQVGSSDVGKRIIDGLIEGYGVLRGLVGHFAENAHTIFGVDIEENYLIDHQEIPDALRDASYPHIAARFILNFVIKRRGLLLDRGGLRARLGLAVLSSEHLQAIETWLSDAGTAYRGAFSGCEARWWAGKVESVLSGVFNSPTPQLTAEQRAARLGETLGFRLEPARDRWDDRTDFIPLFACASCGEPTPMNHSVKCLDVGLPSFVQRNRVCWTCVQTDRIEEHDLRIDALDEPIAAKLRSGDLSRT